MDCFINVEIHPNGNLMLGPRAEYIRGCARDWLKINVDGILMRVCERVKSLGYNDVLRLFYKFHGQGLKESMIGMTNEEQDEKMVKRTKDEKIKAMKVYIKHGINDNTFSQNFELILTYPEIAPQPLRMLTT